jgi:PAS domain S-box-containing protein
MVLPVLNILLVEDSPTDVLLLQSVLEADHFFSFMITHVERLSDGLSRLQREKFDIILSDLGLPDSSGLATFQHLHEIAGGIPIVVFSGNLDESDAIQAVRSGAQDYIVKNTSGFDTAARTIRYAIERQSYQSALQKSEEQFYTAFHESPAAQVITRLSDQKLINANEAYCRLTGFTQEQLIGRTTQELNFWVNFTDHTTTAQMWEADGYSHNVEVEFHTPAGEDRVLLASSQPIEIEEEKCIISTALDITERKRDEAELRLYAEIMANVSEGIVLIRKSDMQIVYVNPKFEEMFGYEEGELIGKNISIVNAPTDKDPEEVAREIANALLETDPWNGEVYNIRKNGETFWCAGSVTSFDHPRFGQVWITAQQDITSRKQAEEHLRQSEEKYRLLSEELEAHVQQRTAEVQDLYDNSPTGYHSLDDQGRFLKINQTELDWLGYRREELIGCHFIDYITASSVKTFQDNFPVFLQRGWVNNLEFELRRKDGSTFPVLVNATAIQDAQGNFLMSRSTVFNNTENKKAEIALLISRDELRIAYAALEKASRAKDEFLANMSHELRTPLNGILGMSEILMEGLRGPLNERQQKLVHAIEDSGHHLLSLINDILDLSKIEAGQLELHPEMISLDRVCMDSLAFVRESATKKGLQIEFRPDAAVTTIQADERYLKQILVNLLNNAVKFTPSPGRVTLTVQSNPSQNSVDLSVMDTGIGIAPADLQRLFQPFTQVDSSLTRKHEGTGLGLALVKRLTESHGGGISVISQVGQGSCFTVSLPWLPGIAEQEAIPHPESEATTPHTLDEGHEFLGTVLLAEDTETNIITMGDYLESLGYKLVYARTGQEAILKASETLPDVILMDVQMPEMDGLEATRRLRADPRFVDTPIVAVTALVMPGDRERCLAAGATAYVSKPIRLRHLANLIRELMNQG